MSHATLNSAITHSTRVLVFVEAITTVIPSVAAQFLRDACIFAIVLLCRAFFKTNFMRLVINIQTLTFCILISNLPFTLALHSRNKKNFCFSLSEVFSLWSKSICNWKIVSNTMWDFRSFNSTTQPYCFFYRNKW